jgi:hypothetical protein
MMRRDYKKKKKRDALLLTRHLGHGGRRMFMRRLFEAEGEEEGEGEEEQNTSYMYV